MKLLGVIKKEGRGKRWMVWIPFLHLHTEGKSKADALEMAKDAIETGIDKPGFSVSVTPSYNDTFVIRANDLTALIAFMLRQQRAAKGLTVREVAARMGASTPTAYARYEQGKNLPSLDKLMQILKAINVEEPVLTNETDMRKTG